MSLSAVTTVDLIQTALDSGVYLPGTVVDIQVKFTDEVLVSGAPTLWLNTISNAVYSWGHATDTPSSEYTTSVYDNDSLDWALSSPTAPATILYSWIYAVFPIENKSRLTQQSLEEQKIPKLYRPQLFSIFPLPTLKVISVQSNKEKSPFCYPICTLIHGWRRSNDICPFRWTIEYSWNRDFPLARCEWWHWRKSCHIWSSTIHGNRWGRNIRRDLATTLISVNKSSRGNLSTLSFDWLKCRLQGRKCNWMRTWR